MNLSISNIAWDSKQDTFLYSAMQSLGYTGLEIAPTRIFPERPYEHLEEAREFAYQLKENYGLSVCSMQSIWYGRTESLFGTSKDRRKLLDYSKQAIDFASAMGCPNLVFGCPKNRQRPEHAAIEPVLEFFQETAVYAARHHTVFSIEANPPLYHTNFINTTDQACSLVRHMRSSLSDPAARKGIAVNLDLGTILENQEPLEDFPSWLPLIGHIHISEPGLTCLTKDHTDVYSRLIEFIRNAWQEKNWQGYLSIEMGRLDSQEKLLEIMTWIRSLF
ncbi:MAG: sugar phosphate isomerase/epimerase [Lachnospiraceae bacterium]|jgi:sugar phosphate isomerase/epimerase|nr:sugar phosphate isomerase/epimerase [Lachnospiraceae bacterium]